jgi:quinol monooxygenase YgiN
MKYIFEVTIKPGFQPEDYADSLIQQAPGALGTELHRSLSDPAKLIAIAHWESKAARDAMEGTPDPAVAEIIRSAADCCEIRFVGEFDEPEWVVMPPKAG